MEQLEDRTVPANFSAASVSDLIADINAANQTPESDTITLVAGATFSLAAVNNTTDGPTGLPIIAANEDLTIIGNGDIIERSTVVGTPAIRLVDVAAGASLTLKNLTLQGGLAFGDSFKSAWSQGGAIYSQGALTLDGVTVQNNTAQGADGWQSFGGPVPPTNGAGGGLYSTGVLVVTDSAFRNNAALGGHGLNAGYSGWGDVISWPSGPGGNGLGGGLYVGGGTVTISSSVLTGNTAKGGVGGGALPDFNRLPSDGGNGFGGGLYAAGGAVTLHQVSATQNHAKGGNGGRGGKNRPNGNPGQGIGGGLYIDIAASVGLDAFAQKHVKKNTASTSDADIAGSYDVIL